MSSSTSPKLCFIGAGYVGLVSAAGFAARGVDVICADIDKTKIVRLKEGHLPFYEPGLEDRVRGGADIDHLIEALGSDKRIGRSFLNPGPGYGGSCFPKDAAALTAVAHEAGAPVRIVESVIASNAHHVRALADRILRAFQNTWNNEDNTSPPAARTIAVLGLAFKANTDDVRWSSSLVVIPALMARGIAVRAYDPRARDNAASEMPDVTYCASADEAMQGADGVVILTEWDEFRTLDWEKAKSLMAAAVIFDARNLCDPAAMRKLGYAYHALGRR